MNLIQFLYISWRLTIRTSIYWLKGTYQKDIYFSCLSLLLDQVRWGPPTRILKKVPAYTIFHLINTRVFEVVFGYFFIFIFIFILTCITVRGLKEQYTKNLQCWLCVSKPPDQVFFVTLSKWNASNNEISQNVTNLEQSYNFKNSPHLS